MSIQTIGPIRKTLSIYGAYDQFEPFTEWMPATGIDKAHFVWTMYGEEDSIKTRPGYQLAEVRPDQPKAPTDPASADWETDNGSYYAAETLSNTDDCFWIRFGVFYQGVVFGSAEVSLTVTTESDFGRLVGAAEYVLDTLANASAPVRTLPIGPWISTARVSNVKAGFIVSGVSGAMKYGLGYRVATADPMTPAGWANVETLQSVSAGTRVLDDTAVSPGSTRAWVQFGLRYQGDSSQDGEATINAIVAVRD